jgi:3-hydroxybutyrate dehydrogenase
VLGRGEKALRDAVAVGDAAGYVMADVTNEGAMEEAMKEARAARGPIDILIANAGNAETAAFVKADDSQFRRMFDLNVMGVVHAARAVLEEMIERGFGRIIAIASTASLKGYPKLSAYCMAKHAVVGLVRSLALETATSGVTVNAVCPTFTDTDLIRGTVARMERAGHSHDEALARVVKSIPLGRLVTPAEVAGSVLYLCSPAGAAVTGATLTIAGGEV